MSHNAPCMPLVKDPAEGFGKIIGGVDNTRNELHDDGVVFFPILDGKMLYVNVSRTFGWLSSIDDLDSRLVVLVDRRRILLRKPKFCHDKA